MRTSVWPSKLTCGLKVAVGLSLALAYTGCQQTGDLGPDSSTCEDEVTTAQSELAQATDTQQNYAATDRVLSAEDAEDNFRGCGGTTAEINAARMATCQYLAMTTPGQFPSSSVSRLQQRCCPSTTAGLQPWCATFDAGYVF